MAQKRKRGRPKMAAAKRQGRTMTAVRLRPEERRLVDQTARHCGQTLSAWMRAVLLLGAIREIARHAKRRRTMPL